MTANYKELALQTISDAFHTQNRERYYEHLMHSFNSEQISALSKFHKGEFRLSGTNHYLPQFIISEEAQKKLCYPQGFLIMEATEDYFTNRAHLASFEISFTLDGEGMLQYRGKKYTLKKGEGYWIDCREQHFYKTNGENWTRTIFHINGNLVKTIFDQFAADGNVKFSVNTCPNFEMLQFQALKASQKIMPYYEYKLSCLLQILLTELLTSKAEGFRLDAEGELMPKIISYLQEHFKEDITIDTLIHQFGINRTTLCEEFKNYTGFTIKKYLLALRLNQAKLLLRGSSLSVETIAEEIGFHDTAHFVQMFKKSVGLTPLQYRKSDSTL